MGMRWTVAAFVFLVTGCGGTPTSAPAAQQAPFLALGDSITADAFSSDDAWLAAWGSGAPAVVNEGARGETSTYAVARLRELLPERTDLKTVGIAFGTNDVLKGNTPDDFKTMIGAAIAYAQAQGRQPMLATIPYSTDPQLTRVPEFNAAVSALQAQYHLPAGPDLYAWFQAHPDEHGPDAIHMSATGSASIQRLWAESLRAMR